MKLSAAAIILGFMGTSSGAETVVTTDGRSIELRADGTYSILDKADSAVKLTEQKPFFQHHAGEYNQNSMRFMPIFKNETGKTIVGFRFKAVFKSAFGDEVFAFEGESSEKFADGTTSTAAVFYFFEDNQFISDEPYDRLSIFESTGTGAISTAITAVVFEGGEVVKVGSP